MGIDPQILLKLNYNEARLYIVEAGKQQRMVEKEKTILAYLQVLWNRADPKDIPSIEDIIGQDEDEPREKKVQTPQEQDEVIRTIAARAKRGR
jgi:hypothetical protein